LTLVVEEAGHHDPAATPGSDVMKYAITTVSVPTQRILSIRSRVREGDLAEFLGMAFAEIYGSLADQDVRSAGPPSVLYHEFGHEIDAEVAVPVDRGVVAEGRTVVRSLPPTTVARTLHRGPYERLAEAYTALDRWARDRDLATIGPVREHYLTGVADGVPPERYRTVIDLPVVPVATLSPA
jgi:effector-binding domain-containing protein